jgi:hypothetical protein
MTTSVDTANGTSAKACLNQMTRREKWSDSKLRTWLGADSDIIRGWCPSAGRYLISGISPTNTARENTHWLLWLDGGTSPPLPSHRHQLCYIGTVRPEIGPSCLEMAEWLGRSSRLILGSSSSCSPVVVSACRSEVKFPLVLMGRCPIIFFPVTYERRRSETKYHKVILSYAARQSVHLQGNSWPVYKISVSDFVPGHTEVSLGQYFAYC